MKSENEKKSLLELEMKYLGSQTLGEDLSFAKQVDEQVKDMFKAQKLHENVHQNMGSVNKFEQIVQDRLLRDKVED